MDNHGLRLNYFYMKNYLIVTSINPPTLAIRRYAEMKNWQVVVVGDKKTPHGWSYNGVHYISPQEQEKLPYEIIAHAPWNLPARVNIGYLHAMEQGAAFITQADDDNIPNEYWGIPEFKGVFRNVEYNGFINIYKYFTYKSIWPRGFPLTKILENPNAKESKRECNIGVWQYLADRDTDVDAIYRLTSNENIYFNQIDPIALSAGAVSPFNTQSTTFKKEVYVLMYVPMHIDQRAADIVRSLIAQPIMWRHDFVVGFTSPTVIQERNAHNYLEDLKGESLIYIHAENIFNIVKKSLKGDVSMSENLTIAYQALIDEGLIPKEEMVILKAWINDVERIMK